MSSNSLPLSEISNVVALSYPNTESPEAAAIRAAYWEEHRGSREQQNARNEDQINEQLKKVREETAVEVEARIRNEYEAKIENQRRAILDALNDFAEQKRRYYSHVERDLVQLTLAIAKKVLHREAQIDHTLLMAVARVAVENLQERSHVKIRVRPEDCQSWHEYFRHHLPASAVEIVEDRQLNENDCVLETELGSADISIEGQLKEIERGFFDLLAQRPE